MINSSSSSFVFSNNNKRFTILNIYNNDDIIPVVNELKPKISIEENKKNKCCIIS